MATPPNDKPVSKTLANTTQFQKRIIRMSNGCRVVLNTSYPIAESCSDNPLQSTPRPTPDEEIPSWDMSIYENRLKTFDGVWILQFITSTQMAKAGFYYIGPQDRVRCIFCSIELNYWEEDEDPLNVHKIRSPHCAFFNDPSAGFDVCGMYESGSANVRSNHESSRLQYFFESLGILQEMKEPKYKDFATLEARLKSFEKCSIPFLKQNIQALCEAGLYYQGTDSNDHLICYYCGQGFIDWEVNDEPWTEHAKWSSTCDYVLLNKGKNFVHIASGVEITKLNATDLDNQIALHKDTSVTENNMKVNSTKNDQSNIFNIGQIKITSVENLQLCQKRDPNTMPDSMLCKFCYKEEMEVAHIPCGHVIACIQCALILKHCALCRQPLNMLMRIYLSIDEEEVKDVEQLPCSSSQCLDVQLDPMLCKVCHKEEMSAAFVPCRHVYACMKCAEGFQKCPVCKNGMCGAIQVYL